MKKIFTKNNLVWLMLIVIAIAPFVVVMYNALIVSDDFVMYLYVADFENFIADCINQCNIFYNTWGGGWPFNFLQFILNPLLYAEASSHFVGVELIGFFLIFIIVIYFFIKTLFRNIFGIKNENIIKFSYLLFLLTILNIQNYPEVYTWFVGNSYMWEATFALLNIILLIKYFCEKDSTKNLILLILVGFIACFAYQLAVCSGFVFVVLFIKKLSETKKFKVTYLLPILAMVAGGCISVFAPGNYARHTHMEDTGYHFISTANYTATQMIESLINIISSPIFILFIVFAFYVGVKYSKKLILNFKHLILVILIQIVSIVCIIFPVFLGYSGYYFPNRMQFFTDLYICICSLFTAVYIGGWITIYKTKLKTFFIQQKGLVVIAVVCIAILLMFQVKDGDFNINNIPWVNNIINISAVKTESDTYRYVYQEIENSSDDNVVITLDHEPYHTNTIEYPRITEDENSDVNVYLKRVYNKESVRLEYTDD